MIEAIINSNKIKYKVLNDTIVPKLADLNPDELTIYIDLDTIFNKFYSPNVVDTIRNNDNQFILSSELLNIIAHYRHYFWSRFSTKTTFYLFYSMTKPRYNTMILPNFRSTHFEKRFKGNPEFFSTNSSIDKNLRISSKIVKYIPGAYIIDSKELDSSVVPFYLISHFNKDSNANIVMTNNKLLYQLTNLPRTFICTLKSDNSRLLNNDDVVKSLFTSKKIPSEFVSPKLLSVIYSISGISNYDIDGMKGMGFIKTANTLKKLVDKGMISDTEYLDINDIIDVLEENIGKFDKQIFTRNFKIFSLKNLYLQLSPAQEDYIVGSIVDKSDNAGLMEINSKYFDEFPLMLLELFEGYER